ncbi:hypothetical protein Droror1_Dr00020720 [Drosera rotundifolia]
MSDQILPPNPSSMNQMSIKRKRGRPRKEKGLPLLASPVPVHPSLQAPCVLVQAEKSTVLPSAYPDKGKAPAEADQSAVDGDANGKDMVGQVVTGIVEAAFGEGYLLTVKIGGDAYMRGVVFHQDKIVPVTPENDVAPNVKMYTRKQLSMEWADLQIEKQKSHDSSFELPKDDSESRSDKNEGLVLVPIQVDEPEKALSQPSGLDTNAEKQIIDLSDQSSNQEGVPEHMHQKDRLQSDAILDQSSGRIEDKGINAEGGKAEADRAQNEATMMLVDDQQDMTIKGNDGLAENREGDGHRLSNDVGSELKQNQLPGLQKEEAVTNKLQESQAEATELEQSASVGKEATMNSGNEDLSHDVEKPDQP